MRVVLALLPKIKPCDGKNTVMQALSVVGLIFQAMQMPLFLMVPPKPTALLGMIDDPVPRPVFLGALGACRLWPVYTRHTKI